MAIITVTTTDDVKMALTEEHISIVRPVTIMGDEMCRIWMMTPELNGENGIIVKHTFDELMEMRLEAMFT